MIHSHTYSLVRDLPGMSHADAIEQVTISLRQQGFGILWSMDMRGIFSKKLGVTDYPPYTVLGACNPPLAHQVLELDPSFGHLLPCNVVVTCSEDGTTRVGAVDPRPLAGLADRPDLAEVLTTVHDRLVTALEAMAA